MVAQETRFPRSTASQTHDFMVWAQKHQFEAEEFDVDLLDTMAQLHHTRSGGPKSDEDISEFDSRAIEYGILPYVKQLAGRSTVTTQRAWNSMIRQALSPSYPADVKQGRANAIKVIEILLSRGTSIVSLSQDTEPAVLGAFRDTLQALCRDLSCVQGPGDDDHEHRHSSRQFTMPVLKCFLTYGLDPNRALLSSETWFHGFIDILVAYSDTQHIQQAAKQNLFEALSLMFQHGLDPNRCVGLADGGVSTI